ncbi:MAG: SprB repeat-containing protein [Bacteroidota bacterium]
MRPFKLILPLLLCCSFLNNPLGAQCVGEVGIPAFPTSICQGSQADIDVLGLELPEGYAFQLLMTTSDVFSFAEVVYQSHVQAIFDDTLPEGTYYLYSAIAPMLANGEPDYNSPCLQISEPFEFPIINLVLNDIPDTIFATCDNPSITVDFVQSPTEGVAMDVSLDGISIIIGGNPSFSTDIPGRYTATIFAGNGLGCTASASFYLAFSDFVLPQERTFNVPCSGDYQVCLDPWDATQSYELDGTPISDPCIDNLEPGSHILSVTRPGCSNTEQVFLFVRNSFPIIEVASGLSPCNQEAGTLTVTVASGTPPYNISFNGFNAGVIQDDGGSLVFTDLPIGAYLVEATDLFGCSISVQSAVNQAPLFSSVQVTNASCPDTPDGGLLIIPGSDPPYSYFWDNGTTGPELQSVLPGTYSVTIQSGSGCSQVHTQAVGSNSTLAVFGQVTDASCGQSNGSIDLIVVGGTAPYEYSWSNGVAAEDLNGLDPGLYSVTVTDNAGCGAEQSFQINVTNEIDATIVQTGSFLCEDFVTLNLQYNGSSNITVDWVSGDIQLGTGNSIMVDESLTGQTISALITSEDDPDCTGVETFFIHSTRADFQIAVAPGLPCAPMVLGPPNGLYYNYQWTGPDGLPIETFDQTIVTDLLGWYTLSATDITGECPIADSIFITPPNCNFIGGSLQLDEGNCLTGEGETPIPNGRIEILPIDGNPAGVQYAYTDFSGNWSAFIPYGTYAIQFLPYVDGLYLACAPPFEVTITPSGPTPFVELLVTAIEDCPRINVDLAIPLLRRCFTSNVYVQYCNEGTSPAEDASITVELDDFLFFQSSTPAPSSVDGNLLTYEVGDLDPFACGQIQINVLTSCEAVLGQSHCVEVVATPNDPCPLPSEEWDGAIVNVRPVCNEDNQPAFIVENTGFGNMSVPLQYIIVEDGVILMPELVTIEPLAVGQEILVELPGEGASYWIQTNQEPLSPGASMPTAFLENCSFDQNGGFSTGFANQFFDGDDLPWYEQRCLANIGAYDPNDKQAIPIGYGTPHYIEPATPIEYTIRFQNTGTDTAFNVYILDEISPLLDTESLRMGASSHDYHASIDSNRTLDIRFDNIMLPDSNVDLAGSQGFVQFTIIPYPELPLPSLIENTAGIYFDFNEPVITNTVFHTVDTGFVRSPSSVFSPPQALARLTVSPNPTLDGQFRLDLESSITGPYLVVVMDALGRKLLTLPMASNSERLSLGDLAAGTYNLAVFDRAGRWLATTKLMH